MTDRVKPGPIQIPNCVEVKLNWESNQRAFSNILHGQFTGASLPVDVASTLFTGFKSALTSSGWGAMVSSGAALQSVWVKDLRQISLPWTTSTGLPGAGTGALAALADSLALVVTLQTAKAGRQWRGRIYLGGLDSIVQQDSRHHTDAAGTAAVAFLTAINSTMSSNSMPMAIAQRELLSGTDSQNNPLAPRAAHAEPVTGFAVQSTRLDSQRKRLGR